MTQNYEYIVSACLCGEKVRYDGKEKTVKKIKQLIDEGKAIMVAGSLPEHKGWLYEASVIDQSGPILTEVVKELFK